MSIPVRELLQPPHLRLTLTAGADGLDRQVSWVHSSDLPNPWEWLGPAELLLTNQTRPKQSETTQVKFLERLAETGASGLGIGLDAAGPPLSAPGAPRAAGPAPPRPGPPASRRARLATGSRPLQRAVHGGGPGRRRCQRPGGGPPARPG